MIRIRAILAGALALLLLGLLLELALVFVISGYYELKKLYPWTETAGLVAGYPLGVLVFAGTMAGGGWLTARLAPRAPRLNAGIAGFVATAASLAPMIVTRGETNLNGVLFVLFGTLFAVGGAVLQRRSAEKGRESRST